VGITPSPFSLSQCFFSLCVSVARKHVPIHRTVKKDWFSTFIFVLCPKSLTIGFFCYNLRTENIRFQYSGFNLHVSHYQENNWSPNVRIYLFAQSTMQKRIQSGTVVYSFTVIINRLHNTGLRYIYIASILFFYLLCVRKLFKRAKIREDMGR